MWWYVTGVICFFFEVKFIVEFLRVQQMALFAVYDVVV